MQIWSIPNKSTSKTRTSPELDPNFMFKNAHTHTHTQEKPPCLPLPVSVVEWVPSGISPSPESWWDFPSSAVPASSGPPPACAAPRTACSAPTPPSPVSSASPATQHHLMNVSLHLTHWFPTLNTQSGRLYQGKRRTCQIARIKMAGLTVQITVVVCLCN